MGDNFSQVFLKMMERCVPDELDLWAITARCIWFRRNKFVHGEDFLHPSQVCREAFTLIIDFNRTND
jgi:hypothetical protein